MKSKEGIVIPVLLARKLSVKRLADLPVATQETVLDSIPGLGTHSAMLFPIGTRPSPSLKVM